MFKVHLPHPSTVDEMAEEPALRATLRAEKSVPLSAALAARLLELPQLESQRSDERRPSYTLGPPLDPSHLGSLGDYDVIALRGKGGMALVFEGFDRTLTRRVAIKLLKAERSTPPNRERFLREAQAVAGLRHDHILPVFGTGQAPDGTPFFAMPLLETCSLRDLMSRGHCLTPRQSAEIALHIADALAAAHAAHLIHRDVKPENILIDPLDGRAKLTDFGLVRAMDRDASSTSDTGLVLGTPEYMAPEQWENPETVDPRCDVYSLGITLYEMLTGQTPFRGHPHLISQQVQVLEPTPPRRLNNQLPRDLEAICLKAIGKEPVDRYATTAEFRDDLRRWLDNRPILARPAGRLERIWKAARRKPALAGLTIALLLAVGGGFAGVTAMWKRAEANAAIALSNEHQARLQLARAEEHRTIAKEAVDKFYRDIYEKGLLNDPSLTVQKRVVVGDALRFYERMLVQELEDPQLIRSAAESALMIGLLTRDVDEVASSIPHFKRAVELARSAVAAAPSDTDRRLLLLKTLNLLALTWSSSGDMLKAEECNRECVTIWSKLVQEFPADVTYRRNLTAMQVNLANLDFRRGDRAAAKAGYLVALEQ
ncbi:MAG: protein kinase, partial [Planctomycetes bacterium]|nr:protein kinase [Planctomycetota bacterium]